MRRCAPASYRGAVKARARLRTPITPGTLAARPPHAFVCEVCSGIYHRAAWDHAGRARFGVTFYTPLTHVRREIAEYVCPVGHRQPFRTMERLTRELIAREGQLLTCPGCRGTSPASAWDRRGRERWGTYTAIDDARATGDMNYQCPHCGRIAYRADIVSATFDDSPVDE